MCGIFMYLKTIAFTDHDKQFINETIELLKTRGPDAESRVTKQFTRNGLTCFIELYGSTLWTQGSNPTKQPLSNDEGSFLLWNGDAYSGLEDLEESNLSDTTLVFNSLTSRSVSVIDCLTQLSGPYSFVYFDAPSGRLWFGRDPIGRTSLLYKMNSNKEIVLASTAWNDDLIEVPPRGFWSVDLTQEFNIQFYPWSHLSFEHLGDVRAFNIAEHLLQHCVLSSCCDYDWLNQEPKSLTSYSGTVRTILDQLLSDEPLMDKVKILGQLISFSIKLRVVVPPVAQESTPTLAILFSGGLDSTLLALVAHDHVPPGQAIDLLNVAFENTSLDYDQVPDRCTGLGSLEELNRIAPRRTWNFVKIDVSLDELNEKRREVIKKLIHPLKTVLDDSLGCALWFAARGIGTLDGDVYQSKAKVIFSGIGADELFGGYSRHRRCKTYSSLGRSLRDEVRNIGVRNLGRDNRVVSDHGRQLRTPFLDERLVAWVDSLPPWVRCRPLDMPLGLGDKLILRLVAYRLGLERTAVLPKKAMQFGTKIANSKERGNVISDRLL